MNKQKSHLRRFDTSYTVVGLILAVVLAFVIFIVIHKLLTVNSPSSTAVGSVTAANPYAVLSPATVPSKVAECSTAITIANDGAPGPIQCSNGNINVTAWNSLDALEPSVMSLGYTPTVNQLQSALCSDVQANVANVIEQTVYQISALYYGWTFSSSVTAPITNGTCVNTDD
jgi:hypothetical protein